MSSDVVDHVVLDRECVSTTRVEIDHFPVFTKLDPSEVLWECMKSCLEACIDPMVDIHNFPKAPPDLTLKKKRRSKKGGEVTFNPPPPSSSNNQKL